MSIENSVIEDVVTMLAPEQETADDQGVEDDSVEYLSIARYHLNETFWALSNALSYFQATDLAESYRRGLLTPQESKLTKRLERSYTTLAGYLGLLDEEDNNESVSEEE
jgi:hypothetical protein